MRAKTIPWVVDPESAADLRPLEQRGGLRWDVEWDRAEQQARGEDGDRAGWSEGVARVSPHSRQSSLVPVSGGCWHSSARGRAPDGSSLRAAGGSCGPSSLVRTGGLDDRFTL